MFARIFRRRGHPLLDPRRPSKRILFATIGSLGDLHPCLAIGSELRRRGHIVTVAAAEFYREKIEALGLSFRPLRPHWNPTNRDLIQRCEEPRRGYEVLIRQLILPELRGTCDDLLAAAAGQDLLVAGEVVFAAPLVAEKFGMRWASLILSPCSFLSAHDPSLMSNAPELYWLRKTGPS